MMLLFFLAGSNNQSVEMISKWVFKAIVQKVISYLPWKDKVNFLFQKYVTKGVFLTDEYFEYKITHAKDHIEFFRKHSSKSFENSNILELGTGWYPIIPISMYLNGFTKIWSIDIQPWLTKESLITTIEKFKEWNEHDRLTNFLPRIEKDRWETLLTILEQKDAITKKEVCSLINLNTILKDARNTNFKARQIDFICSNNTFEHIPKFVLIDILKEFSRIISKEGIMSHFIDMSDHFAHFDKSITIYNFLKYSTKKWEFIDNSIQPQNRLRFNDYKEIYHTLNIPIIDESYREGNTMEINRLKVHKEFSNYTPKELAISHCYLVSKIKNEKL